MGYMACRCFGSTEVVLPSAVVDITLPVHTTDAPLLTVLLVGGNAHDCRPLVLSVELVPGTLGCYAITLQSVGVPELFKGRCFVHGSCV